MGARGGHQIVLCTRDEGVSGSRGVDGRPGLHDSLVAIRDGAADGLVVYRLDRLARLLTVQEATLATVWRFGGVVFAIDIGVVPRDDPDDPMKTALRQMVGVFAQLERGMIAARLRAGRRLKADRGGYAGFGSPPYGMRALDGELAREDHEQKAISLIRQLSRNGCSLREIVAELEAAGHKPKRAARWHPETVRRIVSRV